jgi:hypothetical protein
MCTLPTVRTKRPIFMTLVMKDMTLEVTSWQQGAGYCLGS